MLAPSRYHGPGGLTCYPLPLLPDPGHSPAPTYLEPLQSPWTPRPQVGSVSLGWNRREAGAGWEAPGAGMSPAPSPPQRAAGRSEQGPQPVICAWARASAVRNRYLRMCFLLELAAVGVGAGRPCRNVAGRRVSLALLVPPAGQAWNGMGQARVSQAGACRLGAGAGLGPRPPLCWAHPGGVGGPARGEGGAVGQLCVWGAAPVSLPPRIAWPGCQAPGPCSGASALVFPLGRQRPCGCTASAPCKSSSIP